MAEQIHSGFVILASDGKPFRSVGGSFGILPTPERASEVAQSWNNSPAFSKSGPFKTAPCRVVIEEKETPAARAGAAV